MIALIAISFFPLAGAIEVTGDIGDIGGDTEYFFALTLTLIHPHPHPHPPSPSPSSTLTLTLTPQLFLNQF